MPVQLHWLRAPLPLKPKCSAIRRRAAKIERTTASLNRYQEHFPVQLHIEAQGFKLRAARRPRYLGAVAMDDDKTARGGDAPVFQHNEVGALREAFQDRC